MSFFLTSPCECLCEFVCLFVCFSPNLGRQVEWQILCCCCFCYHLRLVDLEKDARELENWQRQLDGKNWMAKFGARSCRGRWFAIEDCRFLLEHKRNRQCTWQRPMIVYVVPMASLFRCKPSQHSSKLRAQFVALWWPSRMETWAQLESIEIPWIYDVSCGLYVW